MFSVVAEQCLYQVKDFSASDTQPARRLEGHNKLGGDTAGTADPNWPKGYSAPCDAPVYNWGEVGLGGSLLGN